MNHAQQPQRAQHPPRAQHPRRPFLSRLRTGLGLPGFLLLNAVQRRFRRARSGSVLILVIALLVLLALIGTAFITTTGNDRDAATQHKYNTEIEMLVQGVKDLVTSSVVDKVATLDPPTGGKVTFRPAIPQYVADIPGDAGAAPRPPATPRPAVEVPASTGNVMKHFSNIDYPLWDAMLADRVPEPLPSGSTLSGIWRSISASPLAKDRWPAVGTPPISSVFTNQFTSPFVTATNPKNYSSRYGMEPRSLQWTLPSGKVYTYPAFRLGDPTDPAFGSGQTLVLAADADGDGIADAGLFELPIGQIDGVRYYAGVRIIDNASAINASIAWEHWRPENPSVDGRLEGNFTPANVELRRLVEGPTYNDGPDVGRFQPFQNYRQGDQTYPGMTPFRDDGQQANFQWATRFDAFYFGLGQRLDNPGLVTQTLKYRALGIAESAALAYRFCLANPLGSQSVLEERFPVSMGRGASGNAIRTAVNRQPYTPDQTQAWFQNIFDYGTLTPDRIPLRPLLVAHNSVSNYVPSFLNEPTGPVTAEVDPTPPPATIADTPANRQELQRAGQYRYRGAYTPGVQYGVGDWVRYNNRSYVSIAVTLNVAPDAVNVAQPQLDGRKLWAEAPWASHPVRINPNTASFGSLMAAYHAVMGDGPLVKPAGTLDVGYGGENVWTFGDVTRPGGTGNDPLSPSQVKMLRAALAAVNTIDIRDQDDDVTSRSVAISNIDGTLPITAQVYGTERQPYITEAMVHITKNDEPYVVIELYNPHPVPVTLEAFKLCHRDRMTGAIIEIGALSGQTIQPYQYFYVENDNGRRPTTNPPNYAAMTPLIAIAALQDVVYSNRELVLMRTRRYDGTRTTSTHPANTFDENNATDLIPVDQLEFYGITPGLNRLVDPADPTMPIPISDRFHYRRANTGAFCDPWHVVYSGPYKRNPAAEERRMRGWVRDPRPDPAMPDIETKLNVPGFGDKTLFNNPDTNHNEYNSGVTPPTPVKTSTYRTRTLQANSTGSGGPWKGITNANSTNYQAPTPNYSMPQATNTAAFPFGGFARNGDILQVMFVGGYRLDRLDPTSFREMNSITMDAVFAEDGDKADDDNSGGNGQSYSQEQLGRFCPIINGVATDLIGRPSAVAPNGGHRYAWAMDIFDYFNVLSPQGDYLPNIDPAIGGDPTVTPSNATPKWPGGDAPVNTTDPITGQPLAPQPIPNGIGSDHNKLKDGLPREDAAANHGLINVNTAPAIVLQQLPFTDDPVKNKNIAAKIVEHRVLRGPFRNLFDLMRVVEFTDGMGTYPATINPNQAQGDITPYQLNISGSGGDDRVTGDFEARFLMINRISNMVTFRSDSFTAYIVVQGWRNAGTKLPELVAQRRAAIIIDRSTVAPKLTGTLTGDITMTPPSITNVPQN